MSRIRWNPTQRAAVTEAALAQITNPHSMNQAAAKRVLARAQLLLPVDLHRAHFSAGEAESLLAQARSKVPAPTPAPVEVTTQHHQVPGTPFVLNLEGLKTKVRDLHQQVEQLKAERAALRDELERAKRHRPKVEVDRLVVKIDGRSVVLAGDALQVGVAPSSQVPIRIEMVEPLPVVETPRPTQQESPAKVPRKRVVIVGLHPPQAAEVRNALSNQRVDLVFVGSHERLPTIKSKASGYPCFVYSKGTVNSSILKMLHNTSPYCVQSHGLHHMLDSIRTYINK